MIAGPWVSPTWCRSRLPRASRGTRAWSILPVYAAFLTTLSLPRTIRVHFRRRVVRGSLEHPRGIVRGSLDARRGGPPGRCGGRRVERTPRARRRESIAKRTAQAMSASSARMATKARPGVMISTSTASATASATSARSTSRLTAGAFGRALWAGDGARRTRNGGSPGPTPCGRRSRDRAPSRRRRRRRSSRTGRAADRRSCAW